MREILRSGFAELGVPASEEAVTALEMYAELLEEKNKVMNLTAIKGTEDVARLMAFRDNPSDEGWIGGGER